MSKPTAELVRLRDSVLIQVRNVLGNYYGYINNQRVEVFVGDEAEQRQAAMEWMRLEAI